MTTSRARLVTDNLDPYERLACAIVATAADDYRTAIIKNERKDESEIEVFFRSEWYSILTSIPPDMLMDRLRSDCEKHRNKINLSCE